MMGAQRENPYMQRAREALAAEDARLQAIRSASAVPEQCGPDVVSAPARGACVVERRLAMVPNGVDSKGLDKWSPAPTGYGHRANARKADAFDRMIAAAQRGKRTCPLTPGQMAMGRRYAALVERAAGDGMKLSSLDGSLGGGDSTGWIDRHLTIADEVAMLRNRIGCGSSLAVRRVRPSASGETQRGPIMDRVLVDMVCIKDCALDDVLRAHGWQPDGRTRKALSEALSAALDRMIGYRAKKSS